VTPGEGQERKVLATVSEAGKQTFAVGKNHKVYTDVQGAPRFPIRLPVALRSGASDRTAETQNISANGVLFRMDADVPVGSAVDFTLSLPANVVGAEADVQVDCRGRVVRSFEDGGRRGVGVVIDEYRFERR
jgi:PilZ domain-containing protein